MLKILLVVDDFNELFILQDGLKAEGFHVDGTQHLRIVAKLALELSPHIVVVKVSGRQIEGVNLSSEIKRKDGVPKVLWLNDKEEPLAPKFITMHGIDKILPFPVDGKELLGALSELGKIPLAALCERPSSKDLGEKNRGDKAQVIGGSHRPLQETLIVKGDEKRGSNSFEPRVFSKEAQARSDRYKLFLESQEPLKKRYFTRGSVAQLTQKIRQRWDESLEVRLKAEREKFVECLFNEKSSHFRRKL